MIVNGDLLSFLVQGNERTVRDTPLKKERNAYACLLPPVTMSMVQKKRIAITTAIGILTGAWCAASLLIAAPSGITPEP